MTVGEDRISQFDAQLEILNSYREPPDRVAAERAFLAALRAAQEPGQFQALFERLRFTIAKRRRPIVFEKFSETIARSDTPECLALKLRLLIAMHDFQGFLRLFADNRAAIDADGAGG